MHLKKMPIFFMTLDFKSEKSELGKKEKKILPGSFK